MAAQGEPQVQFKLVLVENSLEPLTWSLSPCLLLPHQRLSWTQLWQQRVNVI
uniref:Uncharacterized protein n=1 Tax=Suricata suricatta TaxID=37032 RepID=A0A673T416_SURSU